MPAKKPDRRVQRSREMLLDALMLLLMERGYEKLTIQQVLDRAGVGRATFYAHFQSKEELLRSSIERLRGWLLREWKSAGPERLGFTLALFRHLDSHRRIYHHTVAREGEVTVEHHIQRMLRELVREDLVTRHPQRGRAMDLAVQYVVASLWAVVAWWMENGLPLTPEELNTLFQKLTFPGLDAALSGAV